MLLTALLECAGVPDRLHGDALIALDKLDKIGADGVERELTGRGIDAAATMNMPGILQWILASGSAVARTDRTSS